MYWALRSMPCVCCGPLLMKFTCTRATLLMPPTSAAQAPLAKVTREISAAKAGLAQLFAPAAPFGKIDVRMAPALSEPSGLEKSKCQ